MTTNGPPMSPSTATLSISSRDIFKSNDPKKIARSLKASAERSHRRKAEPYRSAMSMLTFYINRAGKNLSTEERETLEAAKPELRALFGR